MLAGRGKKSLSYNLLHNYGTGYMGWGYRATWCLLIDTNPLLVNSITRWMSHVSSSCQVVGNPPTGWESIMSINLIYVETN